MPGLPTSVKRELSMKMYQAVLIGLGGTGGALIRYVISALLPFESGFPAATLLVNIIGCFLLTWSSHHLFFRQTLPPEVYLAVTVGFIGSFTTFSTFSLETITRLDTAPLETVAYVFLSVGGGLAACLAGYQAVGKKKVP